MARVTLTLSDQPDETFRVDATFEGGYTPASHAHQHGRLLLLHLNEIAKALAEPAETMTNDQPVLFSVSGPDGLVVPPTSES